MQFWLLNFESSFVTIFRVFFFFFFFFKVKIHETRQFEESAQAKQKLKNCKNLTRQWKVTMNQNKHFSEDFWILMRENMIFNSLMSLKSYFYEIRSLQVFLKIISTCEIFLSNP